MDATVGSLDPHDMPTLRDLLQRYEDQTNESRRALGERSGIRHQTFSTWSSGAIKEFPDPDTLRVFADATGYPLRTVLLATARTIGMTVPDSEPWLAASLPPGTDSLEPADVEAVRSVIRQLVEARRMAARPVLDLARVEGLRVREDETTEHSSDSRTNH